MQSKGLSRVFSNSTVQKHQFFSIQLSSLSSDKLRKVRERRGGEEREKRRKEGQKERRKEGRKEGRKQRVKEGRGKLAGYSLEKIPAT